MESNKQETQGNTPAGSSQQAGDRVENFPANDFPVGYRFVPKDFELISYYLKRKIMNQPIPVGQIFDVELYKYNPDDLAGMHSQLGETEWYFFTPRDRKYPNGLRPNRAAGTGYWKATGCDKPVVNLQNETVGYRKTLTFHQGKPPNGAKTNWIMHEFRVDQPAGQSCRNKRNANDMRLDDWVLCRIHKIATKAAGRKKSRNNKVDRAAVDSPASEVVSGEINIPAEDTEHRNLEVVVAHENSVPLGHSNEGGLLVGNGFGNVPEQVYQGTHVDPLQCYQGTHVDPLQCYQGTHLDPLQCYGRYMAELYSFASCYPQSSSIGQLETHFDYQLQQSSFGHHHGYYPMINNNVYYDESSNLYYNNNPQVDFGHVQVPPLGNSYSALVGTDTTDQFVNSILNFGTDHVPPESPSKRQN